MVKLKPWLRKISHYRYFGLCMVLLVLSVITGAYLAYDNRYHLEVIFDDFSAQTQKVFAPVTDNRPKLLATFRDQPPNMFFYSKGRFSGPLRLVLEQAADEMGYRIDWQHGALSTSLTGLENNSIDVVPHVRSRTPDREKRYRFSIALRKEKRSLYLAQWEHSPKAINAFSDLKGMIVGYPQGHYFYEQFQQAKDFNKKAYVTIESMVMAFHRQEIDVMVVNNKRLIEQRLQAIGARSVTYAKYTIDDNPELYFLYSKNPAKQAVYDRLDQVLMNMKKQGVIEDIFRSFALVSPKKELLASFEAIRMDGDLNE